MDDKEQSLFKEIGGESKWFTKNVFKATWLLPVK
jgi:hypothetical protein